MEIANFAVSAIFHVHVYKKNLNFDFFCSETEGRQIAFQA